MFISGQNLNTNDAEMTFKSSKNCQKLPINLSHSKQKFKIGQNKIEQSHKKPTIFKTYQNDDFINNKKQIFDFSNNDDAHKNKKLKQNVKFNSHLLNFGEKRRYPFDEGENSQNIQTKKTSSIKT